MYKKICAYILVIVMLFSFPVQNVYASSVTATAELISDTEWATNGSNLLVEALNKLNTLSPVAYQNAMIVIGSASFAYVATEGITFAVDSMTEKSATIGRWIVANISDLNSEVQRYVASVIFNCSELADYYETRNNVYTARLLNSFDSFLGNYVDANEIVMNKGLMSQTAVNVEDLKNMTEAIYSVYTGMTGAIYLDYGASALQRYSIYDAPNGATTILINSNNTSATFYDSSGNLLGLAGSEYIYSANGASWNTAFSGQIALTLSGLVAVDWGGFNVVQGNTYEEAMGINIAFPLGLSFAKALDIALKYDNDLIVPYTTALDLGVGLENIEEVAEVSPTDTTVEPSAPTVNVSGILDFLKSAWSIFTDIYNAIVYLATAIGKEIVSGFTSWLEDIIENVSSIVDAITTGSLADSIGDVFSTWLENLIGGISTIVDTLVSIPQVIADAIGIVLEGLFIPSDASVQEIRDLVDMKLPIITVLSSWSDDVANVIGNPEAYSSTLEFIVDMSKADTYWDYGDSKTNMIQLDWYFDYKEQVDSIIIGIAWLIFLWNLYGQLPNIISAIGSGQYLQVHNDYVLRERAEREQSKASYEQWKKDAWLSMHSKDRKGDS